MSIASNESTVVETTSLHAFFYQALGEAVDKRKTDIGNETRAYVVNLLLSFSRSDNVYEWFNAHRTVKPLAMIYGDAVHAKSRHERIQMLRRLGDVALFIAGMFGPSLDRKIVGLDYYINMGGGAYDWLAEQLRQRDDSTLSADTFGDLAENFEALVDALDELAQNSTLRSDRDLISLYEKWLRTRDPDCAKLLQRRGISVSANHSAQCH
jgi:hypothetical protein